MTTVRALTPLHAAAQKDASATAEVLLQQGANVNAKNNKGFTPLHATALADASATAEVLLQQGANVHAKDNEGGTPLHAAAQKDASATAEVLLQQGANVHAKTNEGHTPLYFAAGFAAARSCDDSTPKRNEGHTPFLRPPRSCAVMVPDEDNRIGFIGTIRPRWMRSSVPRWMPCRILAAQSGCAAHSPRRMSGIAAPIRSLSPLSPSIPSPAGRGAARPWSNLPHGKGSLLFPIALISEVPTAELLPCVHP